MFLWYQFQSLFHSSNLNVWKPVWLIECHIIDPSWPKYPISIQRKICIGLFTRSRQYSNKELSIILIFFFHEVLQHLKTFIYIHFRFQRVLRFAIEDTEDAWISRLLRDAPFSWQCSWRPGKLSCALKTLLIFFRLCYLNIPFLRININLIFMSSSSDEFTHK